MEFAQVANRLRQRMQRRGRSREETEDLAQEAFLRLYAYQQANTVSDPEGFLTRAGANLSIDAHRREQRSPFSAVPLESIIYLSDSCPAQDEVLLARARLKRANEGLFALPERTREILLAQRLDGLSYSEIAHREGISVSAVEKHIARGMKFLLRWMDGW